MNKYKVVYKKKTYIYRGESALDSIEKLSNRKVFGYNRLFWRYNITMIDADTCGINWAEAKTEENRFVFAEKIENV